MQGNSTPMSGHAQKVLSCIEGGFMSQTTLSSITTWCMHTMEPWSQDTPDDGKHWNWCHRTTGGQGFQICCQVCHRVRCMQLDEDLPYAEGGKADPQLMLASDLCRHDHRTPGLKGIQCHPHGGGPPV